MKHSFGYYFVLLVLRLRGIKTVFSKAPIDVQKVRQDNVLQPKGRFFNQHTIQRLEVMDSTITAVGLPPYSEQLVLYIHGGAFISGPTALHWEAVKTIAQGTGQTVWLCDYPKAPEAQLLAIAKNVDAIYQKALETYPAANICLVGDSVGGTLIAALVQRLIHQGQARPRKIALLSPVMDASLTHPAIPAKDAVDPMLSREGILSAKKLCAGELDLKHPMLSPLYGSFEQFPPTLLFLAENDIMYPDEQQAAQHMKAKGVKVEVIDGKGMPHIWPLLPFMNEAKTAMGKLVGFLND